MKDYSIGEEFQFGKIRLRVEKCKNPLDCENCFFKDNNKSCAALPESTGQCCSICRDDEQSVKFIKVEKDERT